MTAASSNTRMVDHPEVGLALGNLGLEEFQRISRIQEVYTKEDNHKRKIMAHAGISSSRDTERLILVSPPISYEDLCH